MIQEVKRIIKESEIIKYGSYLHPGDAPTENGGC